MMFKTLLCDERGFTLQETVVVMIVSSMLVGFSYALFGFVMHFLHTNLDGREHRETIQHVAAEICTDIERSRSARVLDSALVLERAQKNPIVYTCMYGRIVRNGSVTTPPDSAIWSVQWRALDDSTNDSIRPVSFTLKAHWRHGIDSVSVVSGMPWSSQGAFAGGSEGKTK
jgi:hypothetical protein